MVSPSATSFDSQHEDMIHDAKLDYYGKRLATCSSDRTIRVFEINGQVQKLVDVLKGHDGPVWQVSWSHPKFGSLLASCSYDGKVLIWKESPNGSWVVLKEHKVHDSSVNSVSWGPHELGLTLACASSDGKVSVLSCKDDGSWDYQIFHAHQVGCNSVSWAPSCMPSTLITPKGSDVSATLVKKLVTAGCDNLVRIWRFKEEDSQWEEDCEPLEGHSDWVRDAAWAPNVGLPINVIASCSQDKKVFLWTQAKDGAPWVRKDLKQEPFPDSLWRVSWSLTGSILAVSCGDNKVTLWKENVNGDWESISELNEYLFS